MEQQAFYGLQIRVLDDNPFYTSLYKFQLENELKLLYQEHATHFQVNTFTESEHFFVNFPVLETVCFVDYNLGNNLTGIDVMTKIKQRTNKAKVFIVTDESNAFILRMCLDAGANGIIFKNNELMELSLMVINQTINDQNFLYQLNKPN